MAFYRRHLPHIHLLDHPTFVTFRLHGSLPAGLVALKDPRAFQNTDAILDKAATGPFWLREPVIARIVVDAIHYNAVELKHFDSHSFVVMSNHVHLLLTPRVSLIKALQSLKSITAKRANLALLRTGPFWQAESFDHVVRNDSHFKRIVHYIHHNPVQAGLVSVPEDFPWSSASPSSVGRVPWPAP